MRACFHHKKSLRRRLKFVYRSHRQLRRAEAHFDGVHTYARNQRGFRDNAASSASEQAEAPFSKKPDGSS